jgi:RNA polymerase sigma-B factor
MVAALRPRDRQIVDMRFYQGMSQTQIGAVLGVSQMQVSRLLRQAVARLRVGMNAAGTSLASAERRT